MTRTGLNGRTVIETPEGIAVYPGRRETDRWRAVWYEDGERRQCQAASQDLMAGRLEKVAERLAADAPQMLRTGDELIAYYQSADRRPADKQWSRKHAETQRYLCERFARPVIGHLTCQDIRIADMRAIVNAAPTAQEGRRVRAMISALTSAGIAGGYLASPRLKEVHWQAKGRLIAPPRTAPAGESALFVDPGDIPAAEDVARLAQALVTPRQGQYELMVYFAAYTGLRWGELVALTAARISPQTRAGSRTAQASRDPRVPVRGGTQEPQAAPDHLPQHDPAWMAAGGHGDKAIAGVLSEQEAGKNPLGLMFPAPRGGYWRSSNFCRRVLSDGYLAAQWRDTDGAGQWTWHSLRHVFCTTALFGWRLDVTDVAKLAGHSNHRITWEMYVGSTAGTLDRARAATAGPLVASPPGVASSRLAAGNGGGVLQAGGSR